jgi:3-oxoadipate enol-lactonase
MINTTHIGDLNLYYLEEGRGQTVVLIHGMGSDHTVWEGLIPLLKKDYHILAVDLRGHGMSSKPPGPYTIELFSQDIIQFLKSHNIDHAHFIGHSMGGVVLQQLALSHPDIIDSVTLISTFSYIDSPLQEVFTELHEIVTNQGYNAFFTRCLELANTPEFIENNKELFKEIMEDKAKISSLSAIDDTISACQEVDYVKSIKNINAATLIIAGEDDIFTPPSHSKKIKNTIPNSKINIIKSVGHNLTVEKPQETYDLIYNFLKEL